MNHLVTISFDVDDKTISEKIVESASKQVADEIIAECFESSSGYDYYDKAKRNMSVSVVEDLLNESKEEIIHEAIAQVVKNLHRTKQVKEALEEQL